MKDWFYAALIILTLVAVTIGAVAALMKVLIRATAP